MRVLELFSGTHSFGKVCEERGWEVVSLDIDGRATITQDILEWDYHTHGPFDVIWASPPCDHYSVMNNSNPKKTENIKELLEHSNSLVKRALEIIEHFQPRYWFIENPQTGTLKSQEFMAKLPYYDLDYCRYGGWLRKRTRLWTNLTTFEPRLCGKGSACERIRDGKHPKWGSMNLPGMNRLDLRHAIPPRLMNEIAEMIFWNK